MIVMTSAKATSITVLWQQAEGDVVESYEIEYNFSVNAYPGFCDRSSTNPTTAVVRDSATWSYTLSNSVMTPVEEDSNYSISLTAVNSAGRSEPAKVKSTTQQAGGLYEY